MKIALFLATVCVCVLMGSSSPIDVKRQAVNRPRIDAFGARQRRSPPAGVQGRAPSDGIQGRAPSAGIQGRVPPAGVKGYRHEFVAPPSIESRVTKGHYVCGDKLCKLPVGKEPAGCHGMCQYPI